MKVYEQIAACFAAEGVSAHFSVMGDGNMHFVSALRANGVQILHARHEHCACAMAIGHHSATGAVGTASVTHGPGFTQVATALTVAVRSNVPLVVFAGEVSTRAAAHSQSFDQRALAVACGAEYIDAPNARRALPAVQHAFNRARTQSRPVVLGIPTDVQGASATAGDRYERLQLTSSQTDSVRPLPEQVNEITSLLRKADCAIVLAGRGAIQADALDAIECVADRAGALLATTLPARGAFDAHPFSIGIVGGYARSIARELGRRADLVVAFGASLNQHTLHRGLMFPGATIVQVAMDPAPDSQRQTRAHLTVRADARVAAQAIAEKLGLALAPTRLLRNPSLAALIRESPADDAAYSIDHGHVDPRVWFQELERALPQDFDVVPGNGHAGYFHSVMRGGLPSRYHPIFGFGAIGNELSFATGVATARQEGRVALIDGDGSLMMHIQELETVRRAGLKLLIICLNDGGYGAEFHKLRADGTGDREAIHGRPDFAAIARGFGLRGKTLTTIEDLTPHVQAYLEADGAEVWDVHISDKVVSPYMRDRLAGLGSGVP